MPLKLNVGISKKIVLPDYGSLGTTCNVEVEVDGRLIFDDLDGFHQKVRQAYVACAQAVNDELARQQPLASSAANPTPVAATPAESLVVPAGTLVTDVLTLDIYEPYERNILKDFYEVYLEWADEGCENGVSYLEYLGKHGRIRVNHESSAEVDATWIELHPGKLYLKDVVVEKYLANVTKHDGEWLIYVSTPEVHLLTISLDGKVVIDVSEHGSGGVHSPSSIPDEELFQPR